MATPARKSATRTKKTVSRKKLAKAPYDFDPEKGSELEMKGGKLVIRISRESHPEIYDLDKLIKQIEKMKKTYGRRKKTRDLCQFLSETDKSLQIILRNHLEDAMRKYLD